MIKVNTYNKNAFTLIELAIVIVIISFLIGGVLTGRELINQSNISSTISDIKSVSTAVTGFISKYNDLPGDTMKGYTFFGPSCGGNNSNNTSGCNGNGDYCLGTTTVVCNVTTSTTADERRFFLHLNLAELFKKGLAITDSVVSTDCTDGNLFPATAIGGSFLASSFTPEKIFLTFTTTGQFTHDGTKCTAAGGFQPSISPETLFAIDNKIDDGLGRSGKIQSKIDPRNNNYIGTSCDDSSGNYNISNSARSCGFRVELK